MTDQDTIEALRAALDAALAELAATKAKLVAAEEMVATNLPGGYPAVGLTKRELFAAMAMQGLLAAVYSNKEMLNEFTSDGSKGSYQKHVTGREAIGANAASYADALIERLEKSPPAEGRIE